VAVVVAVAAAAAAGGLTTTLSVVAFVVPSLAIRKDITGDYVYTVKKEKDEYIVGKKYITTQKSYEENTMIKTGLKAGDKVIVKGFHLVSAGVPVNVVD